MGKVKVQRSSTSIDMTPMVDLAFLLVTFFMLTTKFAPEEPLAVDMPTSVSEIKLPDTDILTISISKDGIVFFNMDGKYNREELLAKMGEKYGVQFSAQEVRSFSLLSSMGVPFGNLKQFLSMKPEERKLVKQPGIPWIRSIMNSRTGSFFRESTNPKLRIAIKGDSNADYPVVKNVITTLIDKKVNRFNLITNMESGS